MCKPSQAPTKPGATCSRRPTRSARSGSPDTYLRSLLIQGAKSAVMTAHKRSDPISQWAAALRERVGWQKAAVALANKNARILWAVMTKGEAFDARHISVKPGASTPTAAIA